MLFSTLFIACHLIASGHGFGYVGHQIVAAIASKYLQPTPSNIITALIGGSDLSKVASWADEVKRRPEYRFSSALHYANPIDDEPSQCSFKYASDCPGGKCVVGAIFNYTQRLSGSDYSDASLFRRYPIQKRKTTRSEDDLKFLVHFVGDIHQPLHVSGRDRGGNDLKVRFFGASLNLHSVWDSAILSKRIETDFGGNYGKYLNYLSEKIEGEWSSEIPSWTSCTRKQPQFSLQNLFSNTIVSFLFPSTPQDPTCPDLWAEQINRINCEIVWRGVAAGSELSEEYYAKSIAALEKLLIIGGVRLAAVLNHVLS